jgi:hypothetical protein
MCECVGWIQQTQNVLQLGAFVNTIMNILVGQKERNVLTNLSTGSFSRSAPDPLS